MGKIAITSLLLLTISLPAQGGPIDNIEDAALKSALQGCIQKLECTGVNVGVARSMAKSERCRPNRSPRSCHLVNKAADVMTASCGGRSQAQSLGMIASCLGGWAGTLMVCHKGLRLNILGPIDKLICLGENPNHIHVQPRINCGAEIRRRFPNAESCNN